MGSPKLNNKTIVTAQDRMTVAEFKRLAGVAELDRLYELQMGRVLEDTDMIEDAAYGSTTDWERG